MRRFLAKHVATTTGTLSCFDRLLFKGHLPLGYPHAMEEFLSHRGILFKDLKGFALKQAERLKVHAHAVAERAGRPYEYFESPVLRKCRAEEKECQKNLYAPENDVHHTGHPELA